MSKTSKSYYVGRTDGVCVCPSGVDNPRAALRRSFNAEIAEAIHHTLNKRPDIQRAELLCPFVNDSYGIYFHCRDEHRDQPTPVEQQPLAAAPSSDKRLSQALDDRLPDHVGIERGDLVLAPLPMMHLAAHRAVNLPEDWSVIADDGLESLFKSIDQPSIVQLLIDNLGPDESLELTVRVLSVGSRQPIQPQELAQTYEETPQTPFDSPVLSSRELIHTRSELSTVNSRSLDYLTILPNYVDSDSNLSFHRLAQKLLSSHPEVVGFLTGMPTTEMYLSRDNTRPTVKIDQNDLENWVPFPETHQSNLPCLPEHYRPWLTNRSSIIDANGTDMETMFPSAPNWWSPDVDNRPSEIIRTWITDATSPTEIPQRIDRPHFFAGDNPLNIDGSVAVVNFDASQNDAPIHTIGGMIEAVNAAIHRDEHLWIIATDSDTATQAHNALVRPFWDISGSYGHLYLLPGAICIDDRYIPYHGDANQPTWSMHADNGWKLTVGDSTDSGDTWPPSIDELPIPIARESPDGDTFDRVFPRPIDGEPTALRPPAIPEKPVLTGDATVLYVSASGLQPWITKPPWADRLDDMAPMEAAITTFAETHLASWKRNAPRLRQRRSMLKAYFLEVPTVVRSNRPDGCLDIFADKSLDGRIDPETTAWPLPCFHRDHYDFSIRQ